MQLFTHFDSLETLADQSFMLDIHKPNDKTLKHDKSIIVNYHELMIIKY